MADLKIIAELKFDRLPELQGQLRRQASAAVRKAAFAIEAQAKRAAPEDTGFLKNSIYTTTQDDSSYDQAASRAREVNPDAEVLPEVGRPSELQAVVAVGAEYGVYVELGAAGRPAQPFLGPAAEAVRPVFVAKMKELLG
jgi:HK97 gp10 family phage protein